MKERERVLYLGDTSLETAASYLAGVLDAAGIEFEHRASNKCLEPGLLEKKYSLLIISDYPSGNFERHQLEQICRMVEDGMGLLMIGGWESFTGSDGHYADSPIADILPVKMEAEDDRVNSFGPCLVKKISSHAIVDELPFESHVPTIGGYNRVLAKEDSTVILESQRVDVTLMDGQFQFNLQGRTDPLLVVGLRGRGRVAAFASDVAPHWVGGLVDWGSERLQASAPGAGPIEVGKWYAEFFANLTRWTGQL